MSEDNLPEDAAAPAPEADASPEPEITGLGTKGPAGVAATALMRKQQREEAFGEPIVDPARAANVETNRSNRFASRKHLKDVSGTVTYGKGMPHVKS